MSAGIGLIWLAKGKDKWRDLLDGGGGFLTSWETVSFSRRTVLCGVGQVVNWLVSLQFIIHKSPPAGLTRHSPRD